MPKFNLPTNQPLYDAAERFTDAALRHDDSLFTPGHTIWSLDTITQLYHDFVEQPDESSDSFEIKFQRQLQHSSPETIQFAGELVYVHLLPANSTGGAAKRRLIQHILSWSPTPVAIPPELERALDGGFGAEGVYFRTGRPYQVTFLLAFLKHWKSISPDQRTRALNDPWIFRQELFSIPDYRGRNQREILLYLVHPNTFEPIFSLDHKQKILAAFTQHVTDTTVSPDQQIHQIRTALSQQYGQGFHFYDSRLKALWFSTGRAEQTTGRAEQTTGRAEQTTSMLPCSLGNQLLPYVRLASMLNEESYTPQAIVERLGRIHPPIAPNLQGAPDADHLTADLRHLRLLEQSDDNRFRRWHHLSDANVEDMVRYAALTLLVPTNERSYVLPVLTAPFDGQPHPASAWPLGEPLLHWYAEAGLVQRTANGEWQAPADALHLRQGTTPTIQATNTFLRHLTQVRDSLHDVPPLGDTTLPQLELTTLEERIADIRHHLLIDELTILRIYRALISGQHIILSGPPGTGKTHLARLLPQILWRDTSDTIILTMPTDPLAPPTDPPIEQRQRRQGYQVEVVTATEDWGVRHVIGGIAPRLERTAQGRSLIYTIQHGCLTRAVLANYAGSDESDSLPAPAMLHRREISDAMGQRYRGRWLVIDELTRAPVDAAFGSLLTTLGGQESPLMVPTDDGEIAIPMPADFRIIATLNSFDRHFLNQMSEAMKRRFVFIDVLPPTRAQAPAEQALALYHTLLRLSRQGMPDIVCDEETGQASWDEIVRVQRATSDEVSDSDVLYTVQWQEREAEVACTAFWRIFQTIRVYRQLGTAQAEAVCTALVSGYSIGMAWDVALDTALADTLADQLQVLARDEQRVVLAFIESATNAQQFTNRVQEILQQMPLQRQLVHLAHLAHVANLLAANAPADIATTIDAYQLSSLTTAQMEHIFPLGEPPLPLSSTGFFARRLHAFVTDRGL